MTQSPDTEEKPARRGISPGKFSTVFGFPDSEFQISSNPVKVAAAAPRNFASWRRKILLAGQMSFYGTPSLFLQHKWEDGK
jgi:hypothetical protein